MLFNSLQFAIFFPVVTCLFFLLPHRAKWLFLLMASCAFYMAFIPAYILILFVTITIDYVAAIYIERTDGETRKRLLIASIISTCFVLLIFKYINFVYNNVSDLAMLIGWNYSMHALNMILPIGLSFHTFQSLSYVIEVYRGNQKAERHFGIYSLYVMFYPQLVAGPIERPQNLLHQFREEKPFVFEEVVAGLKLMAWGVFKKVVIADRLAIYVNGVYAEPLQFSGATLAAATVAFAYQIYCDFSGYSDIAIGTARVMGFKLMSNFDSPYHAQSIGEFWKRWHISLSTWFRDYLYIPLGGNRVSRGLFYRNVLITFMVSGLWHGANWTFVVWGALNGFYLIVGHWSDGFRARLRKWSGLSQIPQLVAVLRVMVTFLLCCVAWIFFRSASLSDACHILGRIALDWNIHGRTVDLFSTYDIVVAIVAIATLEAVQWQQALVKRSMSTVQWPVYVRWPAYYALLAAIVVFGVFQRAQFIYFQF